MCVCYLLMVVKYYVNFNLFITFGAFPNTFCGHLISFCHYGWLIWKRIGTPHIFFLVAIFFPQENLVNSVQNNIYFYNKFIMLNYQNSTNVCFSLFFFFLHYVLSGVLGWGGSSSSGQGIFTHWEEGASCPHPTPGYLHPGGETNCTKAASLPVICRQNFATISCYYYVSLHKFKL